MSRGSYGLDERLHHVPARGNRGEIIAFYAVAKLKDGGHQFEVMWREAVDRIMLSTQSGGKYGPWKDNYEEMGRKTVIRRLSKYLPLSIEFATAAAMDGMAESGQDQHLDQVLTGEWSVVQQPDEDPAEDQTADAGGADSFPRQDADGRWYDADGTVYDPDRHGWSREHDRPSVTAEGRFRARRRVRKEEASGAGAGGGDTPPQGGGWPDDDAGMDLE